MTTYRFSNALDYSQPQLAEMHNTSFSGYFFPMHMTPEMSAWFWRVFDIDARGCVVMHDEQGTFAGMARMGVRGLRGWCGGFGIVPEFRGTGASKTLAAQMVQVSRENGLTTLQLEVLTQNVKAIKLYERAGFVAKRRLFGMQIELAALPNAASTVMPEAAAPAALFERLYERYQPDWERELASILTLGTQAIATPGLDGQRNGLLFRRAGEHIQIQGAILQRDLTNTDLAALLRAAAGEATGIQVMNEPEESLLLARCRDLGFEEFFSQHEMFLTL
jgi:ribosomal protein S18 acetylase RimI-like enzyme